MAEGLRPLRFIPRRLGRHVPDSDGCRFCDLVYAELLDEGEMMYPFALSVETMGGERALGGVFDTCLAPGVVER